MLLKEQRGRHDAPVRTDEAGRRGRHRADRRLGAAAGTPGPPGPSIPLPLDEAVGVARGVAERLAAEVAR